MPEPAEPTDASSAGGLSRIRLDLSYDGTGFSGWARQPGRRTVQEVVETALCAILRVGAAPLTVAGRTDAGVHAVGQVAHLDLPAALWRQAGETLTNRLSGLLPADVVVRRAGEVSADFDARFSALWRLYRYRITDSLAARHPIRRTDTLWWPRRLDVDAMAAAGLALVGEHDFAAFCKRRDGASTVRAVQEVTVEHNHVVTVSVRADAFCHSMVRSLVGALIAVGEGRRDAGWLAGLLTAGSRSSEITVAPAHGLTLIEVGYPPDAELAGRAEITRAGRLRQVPSGR
jgi:tRNA pseudouridine38-40 synthase